MKFLCPTIFLVLVASSRAADPVYTHPKGFVKMGDTSVSATDAVPASTDVRLSVPLDRPADFIGTVASSTSSTVTVTGTPNWTTDQWVGGADAYVAEIASGTENGLRGLVTANSGDTLTLQLTTPGDLSAVAADDSIRLRKNWTLGAFFADSTIPAGTQVLFYSGTTPGINNSPNSAAVWSGSAWIYTVGGSGDATSALLHPGESFVLRTGPNPISALRTFGDVPAANHRTSLAKLSPSVGQDTTFGFTGAAPEVIGLSGLGFTPGDQVLAYDQESAGLNKSPTTVVVWSGSSWLGVVGLAGDVSSTFTLEPGAGYVYRQGASAPDGEVDWNDTQEYNQPPAP